MLRVRNVLCPTDFSPCGDAVIATAARWASSFDAKLHIYHALEVHARDPYNPGLALPDADALERALEGQGWNELEKRRTDLEAEGLDVTCAQSHGLTAAPMILDYADEHDVDLIVMSTHGRRGLRHFLLGSVAEEVVQRARCPVLTVRQDQPHEPEPPTRILVPIDLSEHSRGSLAHAKALADASGAEVQLLHVLLRPSFPAYYEAMGNPDVYYDSADLEKETRSALESLYEQAEGPSGLFSVHVARGLAVEEILRFARENSSELLVIASHGLTGLSHLLLGSVAERVVRQAPCAVLTVKSFGESLIGDSAGD
jgi:nucleotide-binding universal stress UspA family protein